MSIMEGYASGGEPDGSHQIEDNDALSQEVWNKILRNQGKEEIGNWSIMTAMKHSRACTM